MLMGVLTASQAAVDGAAAAAFDEAGGYNQEYFQARVSRSMDAASLQSQLAQSTHILPAVC